MRGWIGVVVTVMPSWPPPDFPQLGAHNHIETSPATNLYNCVAWGAGNDTRWWWPDPANIYYWPTGIPRQETIPAFEAAFATMGYRPCADDTLESGVEKLAIYAVRVGLDLYPTHAARQLENGRWTSKLGGCEDIERSSLDALSGPRYETPVCFLARRLPP